MDDKHMKSINSIKGIPYGISDYGLIRGEHNYYVDKTRFLAEIEKSGRYLFFIRPRRFGKSLFISMMQYYYDVLCKDRFEELFKGTWIFDLPTKERGNYLVLFLNFSEVSPAVDRVEKSFLALVGDHVRSFIRKYRSLLSGSEAIDEYYDAIKESRSPPDIIGHLNRLVKESGQKMYVIIDEYDNFANTILTSSGEQSYRDLTQGEGFFRSFFNVLKAGTGGVDAPIGRLFITGVSPVTMDDVTSGFNIGKNVSLSSKLDMMLGFTLDDVKTMVDYYKNSSPVLKSTPLLPEMLAQWYGNYRFSGSDGLPLFNSDMVLYFIDHCLRENKLPENLIDRNVRIDYGKLRQLIVIDRDKSAPTTNGNFSRLKQIMEEDGTLSKIADGFSLKEMTEPNNFISLLFYFGLLTIAGRERNLYRLTIPNETVKRLYYDYIDSAYKETGVFSLDWEKYGTLISDMAYDGKWRPLVEFITGRMKECLALRDLMTGEKAVQMFLNVYLGLSDLFIVHSEKEMNKGYADLVMEAYTAKYPELNYSFLLELKYEKSGISPEDPKIPGLVAEAEEQLRNYSLDEKFKKTIGKTKLIQLVLIFSGHEAIYIGEITSVKKGSCK